MCTYVLYSRTVHTSVCIYTTFRAKFHMGYSNGLVCIYVCMYMHTMVIHTYVHIYVLYVYINVYMLTVDAISELTE